MRVKTFAINSQVCGLLLSMLGCLIVSTRAADLPDRPSKNLTDYFVQTWQEDEGLPRNTITGIAQTPDGYLWLATHFGLVRFDGVQFTTFGEDILPELVNSRLWLLQTDQAGRLWMGTGKGGIIIWENERFRVLDARNGLSHPTVNSLCEDASGVMWVSTGEGSISRITDGKTVESIGLLRGQQSEIPIYLVRDLQGEIWFSQGNSYGRLRNGLATNVTRIPGSLVHLRPSQDGSLWICANKNLQKLAPGVTAPLISIQLPFGNYQIRSLCEDEDGNLWIGTREQGLYQVKEGLLQLVVTTKKTIQELYKDTEGSLWMAAEGEGLRKIRPRVFQVLDSRQGLPNDLIQSLCEDKNGDMWLAAQVGGVARYRQSEGVTILADTTNQIITSVLPDHAGGIWAGTVARGLLHYDGTKVERLLTQSPFGDRQMRVLFLDRAEQLWISLFPSGLAHYGNGQLIWPAYYRGIGLIDQTIWAMTEDREGGLWLGTIEGNVFRLQGDQLTSYTMTNGLTGITIGALHVDQDGTLWVGTLGGGLGCLRNGKFKFASVEQGLRDDVISQIAEDDAGFLWFGSTRGIFRARKTDLDQFMTGKLSRFKSIAYGKSDGLANVECKGGYHPSVWKTRAGRLWFATSKGAIHFDPAALPLNTNPPPLALERMLINGKAVSLTNRIELDWNHQNIEFEYTALSFIAPEKVRFRRQLIGFDSDWVEVGRQRAAAYSQLPPGRYEFRFTACNNDEIWNEQPRSLAFIVHPAWWQRSWFRVVVVITFAGVIGGFARYFSTLTMRRRLARVEQAHAVEKERTRIARDIHDDVGARLTQMAYLSDLASTELPNGDSNTGRLKEIAQASRQTVRALDEIVWAVNPRKDTLVHLLEYISQYANSYFAGTEVRCRQDLPANVPDWVLPADFRHHLFLAAKEALNNIQKHAQATEVWIRVSFAPPRLELSIEDNGTGFSPEAANANRDGLQNMKNRLVTLGGTCQISSQPGAGTRLVMIVTLPKVDGPQPESP
jgi:ligand-binding sensor domain-containing protein/signal transduction histidine kinase